MSEGETARIADDILLPPQHRGAFEALRTRLEVAGFDLWLLDDGSFLVGRWNRTRQLPTLDAVQRFARQVDA